MTSNPSSQDLSPPPPLQPTPSRSSSRKRCTYETDRYEEGKKQCIICCSVKKDAKGKTIPVNLITLRSTETNSHLAEEKLVKFAKIHQKHNTKYKDSAERILLVAGTNSLFTADVGYHKECYAQFRNPYWEEKFERPINSSKHESTNSPRVDSFLNLCQLVRLHVLCRREVYSLADLKAAYESLKTEECPILRVGDIKKRLQEVFSSEVQFSSLSRASSRNREEYILSAGESLTSELISAAYHGGGISNTALLRASATRLHREIRETRFRRPWPPTPQDILQDSNPFHATTFNLIAWIIEPRASVGDDGLIKLTSERKKKKIQQICRNIESLLPEALPSVDQVLLALILHRKTGSRDVLDILHRLGYCISYTETLFTEDVWAEWDRKKNHKFQQI